MVWLCVNVLPHASHSHGDFTNMFSVYWGLKTLLSCFCSRSLLYSFSFISEFCSSLGLFFQILRNIALSPWVAWWRLQFVCLMHAAMFITAAGVQLRSHTPYTVSKLFGRLNIFIFFMHAKLHRSCNIDVCWLSVVRINPLLELDVSFLTIKNLRKNFLKFILNSRHSLCQWLYFFDWISVPLV